MHFSNMHHDAGSKAGRFALVAGLHVLMAIGVVNMMGIKNFSMPPIIDHIPVFTPKIPEPVTPPVEPPKPTPRIAPPDVFVPKIEIDIPVPAVENPVQATTHEVPVDKPVTPARVDPTPPLDTPAAKPGVMRSAVLANASACVTPSYPVQSARNGDQGTVLLALLVGTDGRVTSSRVQKSSGYRELDRAAVSALSLCQFKPAMANGVPEAAWAQIAYDWKLD